MRMCLGWCDSRDHQAVPAQARIAAVVSSLRRRLAQNVLNTYNHDKTKIYTRVTCIFSAACSRSKPRNTSGETDEGSGKGWQRF
jgi:hypothetical protein